MNSRNHAIIADAALECLMGIEAGQYADRALNLIGRRLKLVGDDRLAVKRWLYHTLRWRNRFDSALNDLGDPWSQEFCRAAGRLALAAGFEEDGDPELLNSLSHSLHRKGFKRAASLLPGLAPIGRQTPLAAASGSAEALAEAYSHPVWMVEKFMREFGAGVVPLLEANNAEPPVVLRTNSLRTTRNALAERLRLEGIETEPGAYSPLALRVTSQSDVFRTQAFREGLFEMQDEGSQLVGWVLDPKPRGLVVDACAGAGGKSLLLACLMRNRGRILSVDIAAHKLDRLRERARRAGVDNLQARPVEGGALSADLVNAADAVLVDAPCSGLGALRRNPDAKWRLEETDISELAARQFGILGCWADAVKPGGLLVYSTCTLSREENYQVVGNFLGNRADFEVEPADTRLPVEGARFLTPEGYFESRPDRDGTDGFFAARLRRKPR